MARGISQMMRSKTPSSDWQPGELLGRGDRNFEDDLFGGIFLESISLQQKGRVQRSVFLTSAALKRISALMKGIRAILLLAKKGKR